MIPRLMYGIELWENKTMMDEVQARLNKIVCKAYGLEVKIPTLAIQTKMGMPSVDLLALGKHNVVALRGKFVGRDIHITKK